MSLPAERHAEEPDDILSGVSTTDDNFFDTKAGRKLMGKLWILFLLEKIYFFL